MSVLVFVSDFHIGGEGQLDIFDSIKEFISFLDRLEGEHEDIELVLGGDFFELAHIKGDKASKIRRTIDKPKYKKMFERIKQFSERNKVYYLMGNHDFEIYYEKGLRDTLNEYGIRTDNTLYYEKVLRKGGKSLIVYSEHGSQFDPRCRINDLNKRPIESLGHIMSSEVVFSIGGMRRANGKRWLPDISKIKPASAMPWWFLSNYFYHESGKTVRVLLLPVLVSLIFTKILPVIILIALFSISSPIKVYSLPTWLLVMLILIILIDIPFILSGFYLKFLKRDVQAVLRKYGIEDISKLIHMQNVHIQNSLRLMTEGKEPHVFKKGVKPDIFVYGHTHYPGIERLTVRHRTMCVANCGSWSKQLKSHPTNFKFFPLFLPDYELTYVKVIPEDGEVKIELWQQAKTFRRQYSFMERLALIFRKSPNVIRKQTRMLGSLSMRYT